MEKINIAELLKNCPQGMELDCMLFSNPVKLDEVADIDKYPCPITVITVDGNIETFTKYGQYLNLKDAKCVIFPKGKTTWEGFHRPFKDGDILATEIGSIFIYNKSLNSPDYFGCYVGLSCMSIRSNIIIADEFTSKTSNLHLATEEEKQRLFDAIKANGYRWNSKNKTLEKLIKPIFKVGDRIRPKNKKTITKTIGFIFSDSYALYDGRLIFFKDQEDYELVPNKFDINTLVPFESKVLVRNKNHYKWEGAVFGRYDGNTFFTIGGADWKYCIPYKGNEHLFGNTDDCNDYFKTWEK